MVNREMLDKLDHKMQVMFAVFCAKQVIDLVRLQDKEVCLKAIEAAEGFIEDRVSKEECRAAAATAHAAAYADARTAAAYAAAAAYADAAAAAAYAAADAADAAYAADAADAANKERVILEQIRYYEELLNFDNIVEEMMGL
jgi:hypothetical protein